MATIGEQLLLKRFQESTPLRQMLLQAGGQLLPTAGGAELSSLQQLMPERVASEVTGQRFQRGIQEALGPMLSTDIPAHERDAIESQSLKGAEDIRQTTPRGGVMQEALMQNRASRSQNLSRAQTAQTSRLMQLLNFKAPQATMPATPTLAAALGTAGGTPEAQLATLGVQQTEAAKARQAAEEAQILQLIASIGKGLAGVLF